MQLMSMEGTMDMNNLDLNNMSDLEITMAYDQGLLSGAEVEELGYAQIIAALLPVVKKITKQSNKIIGSVIKKGASGIASRVRSRRRSRSSKPASTSIVPNYMPQPRMQEKRNMFANPAVIAGAGVGVVLLVVLLKRK